MFICGLIISITFLAYFFCFKPKWILLNNIGEMKLEWKTRQNSLQASSFGIYFSLSRTRNRRSASISALTRNWEMFSIGVFRINRSASSGGGGGGIFILRYANFCGELFMRGGAKSWGHESPRHRGIRVSESTMRVGDVDVANFSWNLRRSFAVCEGWSMLTSYRNVEDGW